VVVQGRRSGDKTRGIAGKCNSEQEDEGGAAGRIQKEQGGTWNFWMREITHARMVMPFGKLNPIGSHLITGGRRANGEDTGQSGSLCFVGAKAQREGQREEGTPRGGLRPGPGAKLLGKESLSAAD